MTDTVVYRQTKGDAAALWSFMVAGVAIIALAVVFAVVRIVQVLPNRDLVVAATFAGTTAQAPLGPDGAMTTVRLDSAEITVDQLPLASLWALVLQQAVGALAILVVVGCLLWLAVSVLKGTVFSRTNTVLVSTAGLTALVGWAVWSLFGTMVSNGALARISDRSFDGAVMSITPLPYVLGGFATAIVATAFAVGDRMRRDTAGLV